MLTPNAMDQDMKMPKTRIRRSVSPSQSAKTTGRGIFVTEKITIRQKYRSARRAATAAWSRTGPKEYAMAVSTTIGTYSGRQNWTTRPGAQIGRPTTNTRLITKAIVPETVRTEFRSAVGLSVSGRKRMRATGIPSVATPARKVSVLIIAIA